MIIDDMIGTIAAVVSEMGEILCQPVELCGGGDSEKRRRGEDEKEKSPEDEKVSFIDRIFMGVVIIGIIAAVVCFGGPIWWLPRQRQKGSIYRSNSHISRPKQYYCKIYAYIGWKKLYRDRPIT